MKGHRALAVFAESADAVSDFSRLIAFDETVSNSFSINHKA